MAPRPSSKVSCLALLGLTLALSACRGDDIFRGCDRDRDCPDICLDNQPGGLCTQRCNSDAQCARDAACVEAAGVDGVCMITCGSDRMCEDILGPGYDCKRKDAIDGGPDYDVCVK